jgi:serine/threonine protein kinase
MKALAGFAGSSEQRYEIVRKIASGGMATVYLGRGVGALGFQRRVAIKACHPHLLDAGDRTQSVLEEARVAALIRHPNVVATLDVALFDDAVMIVMEYVEGLTVAGLVKAAARADHPVPVAVALRIAEDALAGLHAAHELCGEDGRHLGVVHRDVSPQNVIVGVDGFAKLADFGVFKGDTRSARVTATGEVKGKLGYVAPEVYQGKPATRRSDVYALGVVLWELCAGRRLFDEAADAATMSRVLAGAVPALSSLRADVPFEIDGVLARALALDPAERFGTAEDFARALESLPVTAASTRVVAQHVRGAMDASANASADASANASTSARAGSSLAPTAGPDDELRTPNELITPARATRPRTARSRVRTVALATACLGLAALAGSLATLRSTAPAPTNARPVDPSPALGASAVTPSPVLADAGTVTPATATAGGAPSSGGPRAGEPVGHPRVRGAAGARPRSGAGAGAGAATARPSSPSVTPRPAATVFDPAEL